MRNTLLYQYGKFISFNAIKTSGDEHHTFISFLPTECLKNHKFCSFSAHYSADTYQKEMVSPLIWEQSGKKFVIVTNLRESHDLTIGTFTNVSVERFTIETPEREDCPTWSPDGQVILFTKEVRANDEYQSELWVINSNGSNPRFLTKGNCGAWSPNGQKIAYSIYSSDPSISQRIYIINFSTTIAGEPSYIKTGVDSIGNIFFSPDSKKIAFEGIKENPGLYLINTDGSGLFALTPMFADATTPTWSPDGEKIAFTARSSKLEPAEIYTIRTDGTNLMNISNAPTWEDGDPSWSPDGSMIVFMSQRETGRASIYAVNSNGEGLKKLSADDHSLEYRYPRWQP